MALHTSRCECTHNTPTHRKLFLHLHKCKRGEVVFDAAVAAFNPAIEELQDACGELHSCRKKIRSHRDEVCVLDHVDHVCYVTLILYYYIILY